MNYLNVLQHLYYLIQSSVYGEIGVFRGASLEIFQIRSVGIDPYYSVSGDVLVGKPWVKP